MASKSIQMAYDHRNMQSYHIISYHILNRFGHEREYDYAIHDIHASFQGAYKSILPSGYLHRELENP